MKHPNNKCLNVYIKKIFLWCDEVDVQIIETLKQPVEVEEPYPQFNEEYKDIYFGNDTTCHPPKIHDLNNSTELIELPIDDEEQT